jgi:hypothetical protein
MLNNGGSYVPRGDWSSDVRLGRAATVLLEMLSWEDLYLPRGRAYVAFPAINWTWHASLAKLLTRCLSVQKEQCEENTHGCDSSSYRLQLALSV